MDPEQLANLKMMLIEFEKALDEVSLSKNAGDEIAHFPGDFIFELLEKAQVTSGNALASRLINCLWVFR